MAGEQQVDPRIYKSRADAPRQRLFIAVPCPLTSPIAKALDELRVAQNAGNTGLRCVDAATLHVTLKFLGAVATDQIAAVAAALDAALGDASAPVLELKGAGSFHGALWLGVATNPVLTDLAQRCDTAMEVLGFAPEHRPFRPHVTVARLKNNPAFDCKAWTQQHRATSWGVLNASSVNLYRSETQPGGARYTVLQTVTLR